ncbi:MAG: PAS domain S-box protein, partial [Methanolobus sp.]|nr:PAS domain S-box protein [Methanolobus sp.]
MDSPSIPLADNDRTEHVCRNSENDCRSEFMEILLETIPAPVFYKDVSGKYIGCNRAFEEFVGKSRENIIGKTVYDMGPREIAEKYEDMDRKLFEFPGKQIYEWKVRPSSGSEKDVIFHKAAFTDCSGRTAGLIGVIMDITEIRQTLKKLQESEKDKHAILNASTESMILTDISGNIIAANEAVAHRLGISVEALKGKNFYGFFPKDVAKRRREEAGKVIRNGKPVHFTDERGGHIILNSFYPVFDREGKTEKIAVFGMDITAVKKAEDAVRKSEEIYRTTIETAIDGYWQVDTDGRILDVNEAYCRLSGYTREELPGMNISDLEASETPEQTAARIRKLTESGMDRFETKHRTKDGRILDIEVSAKYSEKADSGFFSFLRDITERKRSEEREQHLSKVLQAIRKVNRLIIRENDPSSLIEQACENLTETLGYLNAWIALVDTKKSITITAFSGFDGEAAAIQERLKRGTLSSCMASVLESDDMAIIEHRDEDCPLCSLSDEREGKTGLACRLQFEEQTYGILAVSIPSHLIHEEEEKDLFMEIVDDLAFALHKIDVEKALKESEVRVKRKLDVILEPDGDIGELELADIIDHETLQLLMDDFYRLTHIGVAIIDLHGSILVSTGWQDICTKFHRANPRTCAYCIESDIQLSRGVEPGTFKLYKCKNNMWDIATPIVVGGSHVGNLFLGQFFFDDEDLPYETFRNQAKRYGFDEKEYLEALDKVRRWSRETVNVVMEFYTRLTNIISTLSYSNIKLARTLNERDNLLVSLRESENRFRSYVEQAPDGIFITDEGGNLLEVNEAAGKITGHSKEELLKMNLADVISPEDNEKALLHLRTAVETGNAVGDLDLLTGDGKKQICTVKAVRLSETRSLVFLNDITERKLAENEREITIRLLDLLNVSNDLPELISSVTELLQNWSGCEAVGIRLKDGDDYPYYQARGFPASFIKLENSLCSHDLNGQILRDGAGTPVLECMCGNVIYGRFDPEMPFFTRQGSFWTNCTSELLAGTTESDRLTRTRNRCNSEGYESVALIPLRSYGETLGLIQLNDPRKGLFTAESIALF